jgi:hypothetical protein
MPGKTSNHWKNTYMFHNKCGVYLRRLFSYDAAVMQINHVTFNGKRGGLHAASAWICALNDEKLTAQKGGFLFKAAFHENELVIAAVPTIIDGERSYHYNLHPKYEDAYTLIGGVNAQGVFNILFKMDSHAKLPEKAHIYLDLYCRLADFFIKANYSGAGRLDDVTRHVLEEMGVDNPPKTLHALRQINNRK